MIRHYLIAAWRNMAANRLISAIAILGLSAGIATALLMALVVRNQMSFEHFIPGHERTYRFFWRLDDERTRCSEAMQCGPPVTTAAEVRRYPAVESAARLLPVTLSKVQHGAVTGWERYAGVDPEFFAVVPLPRAYGRLEDALVRPDGVVITRAVARKYFGRDDAIGQELTIQGQLLTVRAVIEDLPSNATDIQTTIFVGWNDLRRMDATAARRQNSFLYLRLRRGASFTDAQATDAMRRTPDLLGLKSRGETDTYYRPVQLLPLDRLNLWEPFNQGITLRLAAAALAGGLVLLIAAINFVNLMVAQAARREKEVGVRKASGGGRPALMLQFLGEAMVRVGIAAAIGVALAEWLLPFVNAFLDTSAMLAWHDPLLLAVLPPALLLLALAIGSWPAFILSGFRPAFVLRGANGGRHAALIRNVLVTLQFSILITLAIAGAVMWLQRDFAAREALRVDSDQMLLVKLGPIFAPPAPGRQQQPPATPIPLQNGFCPPGFIDGVRRLSGVQGAVCTTDWMIIGDRPLVGWNIAGGGFDVMDGYIVDPRLFALYGIRPLAGTLPQPGDADDTVSRTGTVINLTAMRKLGFASPQAALGQSWISAVKEMPAQFQKDWNGIYGTHAVITAVVSDFSFDSVRNAIPPTLYSPWADISWAGVSGHMVHIKLSGQHIPETLVAIDHLYARSGIEGPLDRVFLDDYTQGLYRDVTRDAHFFAGTSAIAIILACMGLVGIAVSTAERRTKEIGVRKAMGADSRQIVALLLWQFAQPVLWANVIAWPVAWWLMRRWLAGFAYHIDLHWWVFAGASLAALAIALLTVAGQAFLTARAKPVLALRTE